MKTIKILLGIIAINLTLLTIIQTGIWPPKVQASETNYSNVNYGLVPLNENGNINVEVIGDINARCHYKKDDYDIGWIPMRSDN